MSCGGNWFVGNNQRVFREPAHILLATDIVAWLGYPILSREEIISWLKACDDRTSDFVAELLQWQEEAEDRRQNVVAAMSRIPRASNPLKLESSRLEDYCFVVKSMVAARVAKPILALDWSVERDDTADESLWLRKDWLIGLRNILAKRSPSFWSRHLYIEKWPGNGYKLNEIRNKPIPEGRTPFIHVWVGDNLYFSIEGILSQCIEQDSREDTHVKKAIAILAQVIQVVLRKRWHSEDSNYAIGTWKEKESASFDLNEIYDVIRELRENQGLLKMVLDTDTWQLLSSHIFEGDDIDVLGIEELYILLLLLWEDHDQIQGRFVSRLTEMRQSLDVVNSELEKLEGDTFNLKRSRLKKVQKDLAQFTWRLESFVAWNMQGGNGMTDSWITKKREKDIFKSEFRAGIKDRGDCFDLNQLPIVYFEDFFRGYFTDIPKIFNGFAEKAILMSSVRWDSHEDSEKFREDILGSIKKMAPWWVLITDGIVESFSWLHRLWEVQSLIDQQTPKYDSDIVSWQVLYNTKENRIRSVMIEKSGRCKLAGLSPTEKESIRDTDCEYKEITDVANYAWIVAEQILRRIIIEELGVIWLKSKHWMIPLIVKEVLQRSGLGFWEDVRECQDEEWDQNIAIATIEENIKDIMKENPWEFSQQVSVGWSLRTSR